MSNSTAAEEHLRVIRSLMEKATIYRAISAPTALVGGCAGILASAVFHFQSRNVENRPGAANHLFLACWLGALGIAAVANIYFLRADAHRRGEKFVSTGMRAALRALWPSYLVAAVLTLVFWDAPELLPFQWMLLYGLGLLGTQYFAPRSIAFLGWSFLIAGLLLVGLLQWESILWWDPEPFLSRGNLAMGITFGGFHLIYAACLWPRSSRAAIADNAPKSDV